jgi:hypothetical protein
LCLPAVWADAPVAIFSEPGFPYYIASPAVTPEFVQHCLTQAGIHSEFIDARQLADPAGFNAQRYRVLAYVYGNTFPFPALENLQRFHRSRGCIAAFGGVPFCHPCEMQDGKWIDRIEQYGWEFVSHRKMGTGLWGEARDVDAVRYAPGDPLGLSWMPLATPVGVVQFPRLNMTPADDRATGYDYPLGLPHEDTITPLVSVLKGGKPVGYPVCAIEHHCPEFNGAIDIWAGGTLQAGLTMQQHEQLIVATCAYVLERIGVLDAAGRREALRLTRARYVVATRAGAACSGPFILRAPAPARKLIVLDTTALTADEKLLALTLQGVINRKQPRIYVIGELKDARWLDTIRADGYETAECADLASLIRMFRHELPGCVVYSPGQPHTINFATMLAGVKGVPIATRELAQRYRLAVLDDFTDRFPDPMSGYEWALENLWPHLEHKAIACMAPDWIAPRDYLVQFPMFTFWFDCQCSKAMTPRQALLFERVLAKMPPHGSVYGWWQEGDDGGIGEGRGVAISSQYAKITVCTVGAYNLGMLSGMPMPGSLKQKPITYGSLDRKAYIAFIVSDGDNFGMNLYAVIGRLWEQRLRGKVPIGWGICPTQVELTPNALRYWYRTASANDLFVTMDGLGYIYPDQYGAALGDHTGLSEAFFRWSRQFMDPLDQHHLWFLNGTSAAPQMARVLGVDGLFGEYGVPDKQRQELLGRTAAIWADVNPWEKPWDDVDTYVKRIRDRTPPGRPAFVFVGLNGFCAGPNEVVRILQKLGPDYVAVRPDELCYLFRKYKTSGLDAAPAPRKPLDLSVQPIAASQVRPDGTLVVQEDSGDVDVLGWYTDPNGTAWVRKRVQVPLSATAARATIRVFVAGKRGAQVHFRINGHDHSAPITSSAWAWLQITVPASELQNGENEVWYTGNPEAKLLTGGDGSVNLKHSDFGSPGEWSPLSGELMCRVEVK